jgi:four helix bundle protein
MTKTESTRERDNAFWLDGERSLVRESAPKPAHDLEERTARFGETVIDFAKTIPQGPTTDRIISQLIGAATSVGANYIEADDSVSKREFLKCIGTGKKEARETKYFLRMSVRAVPQLKPKARKLWMEANELHLIFAKIWRTGKRQEQITKSEARIFRHLSLMLPSSFVIRASLFL